MRLGILSCRQSYKQIIGENTSQNKSIDVLVVHEQKLCLLLNVKLPLNFPLFDSNVLLVLGAYVFASWNHFETRASLIQVVLTYERNFMTFSSQESHEICPTKSKCNLKNSFENQNICIGGPPKKNLAPLGSVRHTSGEHYFFQDFPF